MIHLFPLRLRTFLITLKEQMLLSVQVFLFFQIMTLRYCLSAEEEPSISSVLLSVVSYIFYEYTAHDAEMPNSQLAPTRITLLVQKHCFLPAKRSFTFFTERNRNK